MSNRVFVLILAGGSGERFWPLSRRARPKQLLSLFSDETLLEQTLARLDGLVPRGNVLILTNRDQEPALREILSDFPPENILAEPAKRDTAAAIALGAGWISKRDPSATMVVLPADHLIQDTAGFQQTLRTAARAAEQSGELVTIGIKPTWACPGFGYIEIGELAPCLDGGAGPHVHVVRRFREKPNPDLAAQFLRHGNFRWNAGMFIWTVTSILSALDRQVPELAAFVSQLHETTDLKNLLEQKFPSLPKVSIDYAIMEKAERVLMVEAAFDWDDIGGWVAVSQYLNQAPAGNRTNTALTTVESGNNIVYSKSVGHVVLVGVNDLIVVQTPDALLVCRRNEAERIKNVVGRLPPELQ